MEKLTKEDISLLIEVLDSWVERGLAGNIMQTVLVTMMSKGDPNFGKEVIEKGKIEYENQKKVSKEISAMLRVKLINLRDAMEIESITAS